MFTRSTSATGAHFGFYWDTDEAERKDVYDWADALIAAAIKGGMKKEDAVKIAERIFSAGWSAGTDDEAYNSSEN
jgi:hypothetical protein